MSYIGRVLGIGKTVHGELATVYAVSGRSEGSKSRLARIVDEGLIKKVNVGPIEKPTKEQMKTGNLLFYNSMIMIDDISLDSSNPVPYVAVTNGVHTDAMFEAKKARYSMSSDHFVLRHTLKLFGPEPDKPIFTPRIAGELIDEDCEMSGGKIGIASFNDLVIKNKPFEEGWRPGNFYIVSTYSGIDDSKPEPPKEIGIELLLKGETVQELADEFYDWMDEKYVVCSAAAVFDKKEKSWQVAVKNLHANR